VCSCACVRVRVCVCVCVCAISVCVTLSLLNASYGVATISRLLKSIGLFSKRAL